MNNNNYDIDYISFASDLVYSIASGLEENLQQVMDKNDYFENTEGLNQAGFKLMFINHVLQSGDPKPIHIKTSHEHDHRTDAILIYHHSDRRSPYLLLVIEFDYIPLESINEKARQSTSNTIKHNEIEREKSKISTLPEDNLRKIKVHQPNSSNPQRDDEGQNSASLSDRVSFEPMQTIEGVLEKNKKLLLEDCIHELREKGYTFYSEIEKKQITLHSAICAVVCGIGDRIMYEVYDPTSPN
jgi:hypothetical protein